ncbi:MAG: N-acyl homoserine lactonase family protein [Candidatus Omnitrophica bacterium]|nr:N-acyl homoserine lactonase family protein [Candidatus Omnitrophota bacterium]
MYKIYPIKIAQSVNPEPSVFYLGDCSKTVEMFTYIYLIKSDGKIILVDTGFGIEEIMKMNPGMKQAEGEDTLSQLSARGIKPEEITDIILTHVHWDHFSPVIGKFTNAVIYVQEKDVRYVLDPPHPWFAKFVFVETVKKLTTSFKSRVHFLNGDEEILPGISVFLAGGHSPGSQAVKVKTQAGNVIIAGDVVFHYRNIDENIPIGFNCNLEECFSAMKRIREEADIVLPGHDPLVLEKYKEI